MFSRALVVGILTGLMLTAPAWINNFVDDEDCSTDTECMAKYGGDGGPEPSANAFVCIHKQNTYPCIRQ